MSVTELLRTHSSEELTEWMAYENVAGPIGPERFDVLNAILAATVANTARAKGRKAEPKDFIPEWDQNTPGMGVEEMLAAAKAMNRSLGGTDLTDEGGRRR